MNELKYELTDISYYDDALDVTLHRIRALKNFGNVAKGELGGFIQRENNLSQEGDCWVFDDAKVFGNARVENDALVDTLAIVRDFAHIRDRAVISDLAVISDFAVVEKNAHVLGKSNIMQKALITGSATVYGSSVWIGGGATIGGFAKVGGLYLHLHPQTLVAGAVNIHSNEDYVVFALPSPKVTNTSVTWCRSDNRWYFDKDHIFTEDQFIQWCSNHSYQNKEFTKQLHKYVKSIVELVKTM